MNDDYEFNKRDYNVLDALYRNNCNSSVLSMTIEQFMNLADMSYSKARTVVRELKMTKLISEGARDGKQKTYYITPKGIKHYEDKFNITNDSSDDDCIDEEIE